MARQTPTRQLRPTMFQAPNIMPRFPDLRSRTDPGENALAAQLQSATRNLQAQAQSAANFDRRIEQFKNSMMTMAGQAAQIEGQEYGIQEAPDVSIIKDAYGRLTTKIDGDIVGDKFSTFGKAARKAALEQLSTKLEVAATIKLKEMVTGAIDPITGRTALTPTDLRTNMDSLIQNTVASAATHSQMLSEIIGPKLTLLASTQFKTFNSKYLSERQEENEATAKVAASESLALVKELILQGNVNTVLFEKMRKSNLENILRTGGDPTQYLKDWETGVSEAKVQGFITASGKFSPAKLLLDFHDYQLDEKWSDDLHKRYATLSKPEQIEAIKALNVRADNEHALMTRAEASETRRKNERIDALTNEFSKVTFNVEDPGDEGVAQRAGIIDELKTLHGTEGVRVAQALTSTGKSDSEVVNRLELHSANGTLTREMVMGMVERGLLFGDDVSKFLEEITAGRLESSETKAAFAILSDALKLPPPETINQSDADRIARRRYMAMKNDIREKLLANELVTLDGKTVELTNANVIEYARSLITQDELIKAAKNNLIVARKALGFGARSSIVGDLINGTDDQGNPDPVRAVQNALGETSYFKKIDDSDTRSDYENWIEKYNSVTKSGYEFTHEELKSGILSKERSYE